MDLIVAWCWFELKAKLFGEEKIWSPQILSGENDQGPRRIWDPEKLVHNTGV